MISQKHQIRSTFGAAANSYDQFSDLQSQVSTKLFKRLFVQKPLGDWVMDLGCGTGHFSELMALESVLKKIIGVDFARSMLNIAQSKNTPLANHCWLCADANQLPIRSDCFDIIFSSLMLQWCGNLAAVFSEIKRIIKPGGIFAFSTLGERSLMELKKAWSEVDQFCHVNDFHNQEMLHQELKHAGFMVEQLQSELIVYHHQEVLTILQVLKGVGGNTVIRENRFQRLTGKGRLKSMVDAYEQFRRNRLLPVTYEIFYVIVKA